MIFDMPKYYNMLSDQDIDMIYCGPLWADGIEQIAITIRQRLKLDGLSLSTTQTHAVFSVFVEQLNNMLMYSEDKTCKTAEKSTEESKGIFILGVKNDSYFIQSGNVIKSENVTDLKERIDYINTLDKEQLRQYYKKEIKSDNTNPNSKGGGLGLIEIARRASSKIEYSFDPQGEEKSFFSMCVTVG